MTEIGLEDKIELYKKDTKKAALGLGVFAYGAIGYCATDDDTFFNLIASCSAFYAGWSLKNAAKYMACSLKNNKPTDYNR